MPSQPLTETHATFGALLRRPYECMSQWMYAELAQQGYDDVRPAFSAVLRNLPADGSRVSELAQRAGVTKQSMGYLVDQMAAAGLVEVTPDANDRRANTVRLTARGTEVVEAAIGLSARYEAHLGTLVGERKLAQLRATLAELYAALETGGSPQLA